MGPQLTGQLFHGKPWHMRLQVLDKLRVDLGNVREQV